MQLRLLHAGECHQALGVHLRVVYAGDLALSGTRHAAACTACRGVLSDSRCAAECAACRGVLLCGPPGTGKTLAARAVATACAQASPQPVAFFARCGADCLGKWAGDAERNLRLLFDEVGLLVQF